ncbi:hypothetical protein EST38_g7649 [Candolleomyces aberdarensis]|uniref:F-box domain-containing protein n=1 Tax=Candolleomyces aberdarensis TaxID=2316362 RepID=A0A4Q2DHZ4_9AGAR|nr:hypothetical protein EST38_g7649 [Candolleomyces aberdarensis]
MDPRWPLYLLRSSEHHRPLFPGLQSLYIMSLSDLAIFTGFSAVLTTESLRVELDVRSMGQYNDYVSLSLIYFARERALNLKRLEFAHFSSLEVTSSISTLDTLTSLSLTISNTMTADGLKCLERLALLEYLNIEHNHDSHNVEGDGFQFPSSRDLPTITSQASSFPNLQTLVVKAPGKTQFLVASLLSPTGLETVTMNVINDNFKYDYRHIALVPFAAAIHTKRNRKLKSLEIQWNSALFKPEASNTLRNDVEYSDLKPFLTGLWSLRNVTRLKVVRVPWCPLDIVLQILKILPSLQSLKELHFVARRATMDELILPPLSALEDIAKYNLRLEILAINMDTSIIPPVPSVFISTHDLQVMCLYPFKLGVDATPFPTDETSRLARYIDRLFPKLESLTRYWSPKPKKAAYRAWVGVEKIVRTFQEVRAWQAAADAAEQLTVPS